MFDTVYHSILHFDDIWTWGRSIRAHCGLVRIPRLAIVSSTYSIRPTYPSPMSAAEINAALVMPYTAYTIMGKGGVIAVLLMVFQAITSAMSSGKPGGWPSHAAC